MSQLVDIVRAFSLTIEDGRSLRDVHAHLLGEADELAAEIAHVEAGEAEGEDGVVGEAVDVILCALDMIFRHAPRTDDATIDAIAAAKCRKWASNIRARAQAETGSA